MTGPAPRNPYDHALHTINETSAALSSLARQPNGSGRPLDGPTAVGALNAWSNLAIASALVAIADALRAQGPT